MYNQNSTHHARYSMQCSWSADNESTHWYHSLHHSLQAWVSLQQQHTNAVQSIRCQRHRLSLQATRPATSPFPFELPAAPPPASVLLHMVVSTIPINNTFRKRAWSYWTLPLIVTLINFVLAESLDETFSTATPLHTWQPCWALFSKWRRNRISKLSSWQDFCSGGKAWFMVILESNARSTSNLSPRL